MPVFSKRSKRNLRTTHPDLRRLMNVVIRELDITVLEGVRSKDRQNRLYEEGRSQVRWPNSNHNVRALPNPEAESPDVFDDPSLCSHAIDVCPYPVDWDDTERFKEMGFYVLGVADGLLDAGVIEHRVVWGGDWDRDLVPVDRDPDESFFDSPHFELVQNHD